MRFKKIKQNINLKFSKENLNWKKHWQVKT